MRAHFTRPVTDQLGNLLSNIQVSIYDPATTNLVSDVVYSTDTGTNVLTNPYISSTGVIDFYLTTPRRVRLGVIQGTLPVQYYEDVDVLAAGADSPHIGGGANSLVIGLSAVSPGSNAVALGPGASAAGVQAVAVGGSANALGDQSVAISAAAVQGAGAVGVGNGSTATGVGSVAVGVLAAAGLDNATALGNGATANFAHATAIGAGAVANGSNQVMLGTATDIVIVPNLVLLTSPSGYRFGITVDDTGSLTTTAM